jgi:DNA-binding ferritin-like protein
VEPRAPDAVLKDARRQAARGALLAERVAAMLDESAATYRRIADTSSPPVRAEWFRQHAARVQELAEQERRHAERFRRLS